MKAYVKLSLGVEEDSASFAICFAHRMFFSSIHAAKLTRHAQSWQINYWGVTYTRNAILTKKFRVVPFLRAGHITLWLL